MVFPLNATREYRTHRANPRAISAVAAVALGVHLFMVFYEEPTLRKKFGADYKEYCRNVRR